MPAYDDELISSQRGAIRTTCLLAAGLLIAFALLDRAIAPQVWLPLLGVRVVAGALLLVFARLAARLPPLLICALAVGLIAATIEIALLATGGADSPYVFAMMIVQAGIAMLVPLTPLQ